MLYRGLLRTAYKARRMTPVHDPRWRSLSNDIAEMQDWLTKETSDEFCERMVFEIQRELQ